ncbi:MAG: ATP-dependent RecD-like DNA helicase [Terrimicrobiaceae bacterium]|nr:ATP-dependent RecD-like DNA helicase [Terrimicrobiaceae bacterium]
MAMHPDPRDGASDALRGLIERVTFHNEETGFAVLRVKVRGRRELVPIVGSVAAVTPGEWITAEGKWTRDREHGPQFRADHIETQPPDSREGIEKYLASGLIRGIGPVYAKKLVERFGEQVFDIIENQSARLQEVGGIGAERRRAIKQAWADQRVVREIMVFLHAHGISASRAVRIFKTYGAEAIERIRTDPYCLARDIHGIGFQSADLIAERLGLAGDSLLRVRAGLAHVLAAATDEGHCALPRETLVESAAKLLSVENERAEEVLVAEIARGGLETDRIYGAELIFAPALRKAEILIAERIGRLSARVSAGYPSIDVERALAWVQERTGKVLAVSQAEALRLALNRSLAVITGGPGVGKTTLLNSVLKILRAKNVRCMLCAPTGRAAKRLAESTGLEAKTIHRLLEPSPGGGFRRDENTPLEGDLFVMDEVSMVDVPLMARFLRAMPRGGNLLLVGDPEQLPSVGPGLVLRDLIATAPCVKLDVVFRQEGGSSIVTSAHAINAGHLPELAADGRGDFFFIDRETPEDALETLLELVSTRIPAKFGLDPLRDIQVLAPMNRGTLGVRNLNARLQDALNPARGDDMEVERFGVTYRAGDKVIQTRNNYDKDVFNGDIGRIEWVDAGEREVRVRFDERTVGYDFGELDELAPAFAITVHKSQGSEYPCVIVPLAMEQYVLLQRNLLYTAVTRGRRLVVLVGQKRALGAAVRNQTVKGRCSGLLEHLKALVR